MTVQRSTTDHYATHRIEFLNAIQQSLLPVFVSLPSFIVWHCVGSKEAKKIACFFDQNGIVHYEFISQGQTVNQQCYLEVLIRLRESVRRKSPGLWPDNLILQHDNAPAHDALRFREFLAKNSITKMDHPPYSPDLAPCDF